jgi:hypothetical protein
MAIELSKRNKILVGVVGAVAVGAAAWVFFLDDFLNPPPPPKAVAAAAPAPKAAAPAEQAKATEAGKAGADAPKAEAGGEPAKPGAAKPIPSNPDQLIADVIDSSGLKRRFQTLGGEFANFAAGGGSTAALNPEGMRQVQDAVRKNFDSEAMTKQVAASLKSNLDIEKMSRFLEILRQPLALKLAAEEAKPVQPAEFREFAEGMRKNPPSSARTKAIQALDDVTHSSALGGELLSVMVQNMVDTMLTDMQKAGKKVNPDARRQVGAQLNAMRGQIRGQILSTMHFMYRNVSDEDLAAYAKLYDTDTARWGTDQITEAMRPVMTSGFSSLGKDIGHIALASRGVATAKAAAKEPPPEAVAKAESATPAAPAQAVPAVAVEPVGYRRASNVRELYTRYNDLLSATVMRDKAGVKELLDDGKFPNVRQKDGLTPLMIAAANGDNEIVAMLLAKGADPNMGSGGKSTLSFARLRGAAGADTVRLLQAAGARD